MKLHWKRGSPAMTVDLEKGDEPTLVRVVNAVRNHDNGRRSLSNPEDVVFTTPLDGSPHYPFMPTGFPAGTWHLTEVRPKTDPYVAPAYIATDAHQLTERWTIGSDGSYGSPTGQMVPDGSFGLHFSSSPTTLGCIKLLDPAELGFVAGEVSKELKLGRVPTLTVED